MAAEDNFYFFQKYFCEMFAYYPLENATCQSDQKVQKTSHPMEDSITMASG